MRIPSSYMFTNVIPSDKAFSKLNKQNADMDMMKNAGNVIRIFLFCFRLESTYRIWKRKYLPCLVAILYWKRHLFSIMMEASNESYMKRVVKLKKYNI